MPDLLLYGAYGYTGRLVTAEAARRGLPVILAGRDPAKVEALAGEHRLPWRAFDLQGGGGPEVLEGVSAVPEPRRSLLEDGCADGGPVPGCGRALRRHHWRNISVRGVARARRRGAAAAGVVLLPGAGFDVVPSDCLAAHLHRRLPGATSLQLVIGGLDDLSRGTAKTGLESIAAGTKVRRGGRIVTLDEMPRGTADLGSGLRPTVRRHLGGRGDRLLLGRDPGHRRVFRG